MNREANDALWMRLEALVLQWRALGEGDEAVRMKLNVELGQVLTALYPLNSEAWEFFSELWADVQNKFDPSMGSLQHYWKYKLKKIELTMRRRDLGDHRKSGADRDEWVSNASLDKPISDDAPDGGTYLDLLPSGAAGPENQLEMRETFPALVSLILDLPTKLRGQANNPARIRYYRMFFTDEVTDIIAQGGGALFLRHERDLFRAMYLAFLDFFMAAPCRTVDAVERTHLRPYGEMVPGRPMEAPNQPLPIDVYTQYLRTEGVALRSDATISNQRDAYRTFKRENLL